MKVLAADSDTLDGWLGTLALVDELGRWPSAENYGLLRAGVVPRDGQIVAISTASDDEANPLGQLRAKAMALPTFRRDPGNPKHKIATSPSFALHEWSLDPGDVERRPLGWLPATVAITLLVVGATVWVQNR